MIEGRLVLSEKAAADLHVTVGSRVTVRHPSLVGASYELITSEFTVAALQPGPLRSLAFLDLDHAPLINLASNTSGTVTARHRIGLIPSRRRATDSLRSPSDAV